jgi:hypothetical protein
LATKVSAESHPAFNIEKTKMELAGQGAVVNEHPGVNPEKTKMDMLVNETPTELNQPEWDNRMP